MDDIEELIRLERRRNLLGLARVIRDATGVTQAQVAAVIGVSRASVARWESGERVPRGQIADRYEKALLAMFASQRDEPNKHDPDCSPGRGNSTTVEVSRDDQFYLG